MRIPPCLGVCSILLLAAKVAYRKLAPIGLSEVHARWFDNGSLCTSGCAMPATARLRDRDAFTTRLDAGHLETALVFEQLRGGAPLWEE